MKAKKDNQREIIIIEATAWAFVFGIIYMLARLVF